MLYCRMTVREQIKQKLEERGLSQRQVARALGMAPQYMSELLNMDSETVPERLVGVLDYLGLELAVVDRQENDTLTHEG